jgi:hypothetical protein
MPELVIRFASLSDMMDFIGVTGNTGDRVAQDGYVIRGFFSDAETELAANGMGGEVTPIDKH